MPIRWRRLDSMSRILCLCHAGSGIVRGLWGHVGGLEKYECVSWKVFRRLSMIGSGSVL